MRRSAGLTVWLTATFLVLLWASPADGQEQQKVGSLEWKVLDLRFKVTDLTGNLVEVGGRVEEIRVAESPTEITIDLAADVLFEFDKANLLPAAEETLQKAAAFVRDRARGTVRIEGHTDSKGDDNYNLRLSRQRAESVRDWLVRKGNITTVQYAIDGLGEKKPVAPNEKADGSDDPQGRQKNRRVQIVMRKAAPG